MKNTWKWITSLLLVVTLTFEPIALPFVAYAKETLGSSNSSSATEKEKNPKKEESTEEKSVAKVKLEIATEEELFTFATDVNQGKAVAAGEITLTRDITLTRAWIPIGATVEHPFTGVFDGKGHKITDLSTEGTVEGGLFGHLLKAQIKNVELIRPITSNSVSGFYFSAVRSDLVNCHYRASSSLPQVSVLKSSRASIPPWDGSAQTSWYNPTSSSYVLRSPEDLAGLARLVNVNNIKFAGKTIYLEGDFDFAGDQGQLWTPIGKLTNPGNSSPSETDNIFQGNLIGNNVTLSNIKTQAVNSVGLFGYLDAGGVSTLSASIGQLTIKDSEFIASGPTPGAHTYAGALAGIAMEPITNIYDITVIDCTTSAEVAGSVIGHCGVFNCENLVAINPTVSGSNIGGLMGFNGTARLTHCTVVGATLSGAPSYPSNFMGGFFSTGFAGSEMNECLAIGVVFEDRNSSSYPRLSASCTSSSNLSNSYLTGMENHFSPSQFTTLMLYNTSVAGNFTDSDLFSAPYGLNNNTSVGNVVDSHYPPSSLGNYKGIHPYTTDYLTNGVWAPDFDLWEKEAGYYPQLKFQRNSDEPLVRLASALGSIPLRSTVAGEDYVAGTSELQLLKHGPNGEPITWVIESNDVAIKSVAEKPYNILYNKTPETDLAPFSVVAKMERPDKPGSFFEKRFHNIKFTTVIVEEDYHMPPSGSTIPLDQKLEIYFMEPISLNPSILDMIRLYEVDGTQETLVEAIPCTTTDPRFQLDASNNKKVTLKFVWKAGKKYRVVLPEKMVKASAGNRYSTEISYPLETAGVFSPVIIAEPPRYEMDEGTLLTESTIKTWFKAYEKEGGTELNNATASLYQGTWKDDDPLLSMQNAFQSAEFPDGQNTIRYYFDSPALKNGTPLQVGQFRLYIMVKNAQGKTAQKIIPVTVKGSPSWLNEQSNIIHIPWTNNRKEVEDAATKSMAGVIDANGNITPVAVNISIPEEQWEHSLAVKDGPSKLEAVVYMPSAPTNSATRRDITIYLDRPLYWTIAPSPVTMSLSTPNQVEKAMNVFARNFKSDDLIYEHWDNDYRKPGLYYVDVTCEPQLTTLCEDPDCHGEGTHPSDTIMDTFIINMIETPGREIDSMWGHMADDIEQSFQEDIYSQKITNNEPELYKVPSYVLDALEKQDYGAIQLNYFDQYRWTLYSSELFTDDIRHDSYSLKTEFKSNPKVTALLGNQPAVQFEFTNIGKLFGTVEFDVFLDETTESMLDLRGKELGLYWFNPETNRLELTSDVIIRDGWASGVLSDTYPTTYVLKAKKTGETLTTETFDVKKYYLSNRVVDPSKAQTFSKVALSRLEEYLAPMSMETNPDATVTAPSQKKDAKTSILLPLVIVLVIGCGIGSILWINKKKKSEEDSHETN